MKSYYLSFCQIRGLLLLILGLVAFIAAFFPIMIQGKMGVTIAYLADYTDFSWLAAVPLGLFVIAATAVITGLSLLTNHTQSAQFWLLLCGVTGLLLTAIGITEGLDHIIAFRNACSALQLEEADMTAPITLGIGGILAVSCYISMTASGVFILWDY